MNYVICANMASLDIILPAYNPLPGWEDHVISRYLALKKAVPDLALTLYIVNDGSKLMEEEVSRELIKASIPELKWISYEENRGKGHALREGVKQSTADFIVYTDIDWPYMEDSMIDLIHRLTSEADAVIGKRDAAYYGHLPPARRRISKFLRKINATLLRLKVDDTQAGLKGFRRGLKEIFLSTTIDRYLFDLEFIYLLSKDKNIQIVDLPITLRPGISFSKMNRGILFEEAGNFLKLWLKGRRNDR